MAVAEASATPATTAAPPAKASRARWLVVLVPYLWLLILFLIPFVIVIKISLSATAVAQPPYEPTFDLAAGLAAILDKIRQFSLDNYQFLTEDALYIRAYLSSLEIAVLSTFLTLLVGYPIAYGMARAPRAWQPTLVMLVILPFWTSFLIRVYAWINILQRDGLLNDVLMRLHLIDAPRAWLASDTAIYIGVVYSYLPFMVLPLYASLEKMDESLLEAAADLGAPRWKAFWLVTVPLSASGIIAGVLLCFIPIAGEFVIPDLLGGSDALMIGQTLWTEFFQNKDWPVESAVAIALLVILLAPILIYQHLQMRAVEDR